MGRTKLSMKRSGTRNTGTSYVQPALKKRNTVKPRVEKGEGLDFHDIKEKDVVDECETAALSTLSEETTTAMSETVKEIAPLCSICSLTYWNLVEEYEIGVEEDSAWKVVFVLVEPS